MLQSDNEFFVELPLYFISTFILDLTWNVSGCLHAISVITVVQPSPRNIRSIGTRGQV